MREVITIRKVNVDDAHSLAFVQTESWKSAFSGILSETDLDTYTDLNRAINMYATLLSKNIGNGLILTIDETPHCIAYYDKTRDEDMEGYAEIICIHSLRDNWGKGYGTAMMNHLLSDIKKAGFNKVMLWVFKENHRARQFYEKHGFILTEKSKTFRDAIEVMYCKEL